MEVRREVVYLAALLHDIGKFFQRADPHGVSRSTYLSQQIKNLEPILCPKNKEGTYSHKHVLWTAQFIEDHNKVFTDLLRNFGVQTGAFLRLAAAHHNPSNEYERLIQKADHYSSGADRSLNDAAWQDAAMEEESQWDAFKRIKMKSVFEGVSLKDNGSVQYSYNLPVSAIELSKSFFPIKIQDDQSTANYEDLWKAFETEFKLLPTDSIEAFNDSLLFLLEKYTTRVPSSTMHLPDVSLFDHLKTTAAFALSLYDYCTQNGHLVMPNPSDNPFVLVGGDLSGIQQYIYGIAMKNAAKNLKGRSFYLQLLMDNIIHYIKDGLKLFEGNIIYSSGGGFYLLAANTSNLSETIIELEREISEKIFEYHENELFLAIDFIPFGESEIFRTAGEDIGSLWGKLTERLNGKKRQRHKYIIQRDGIKFFMPKDRGGEADIDAFDGRELTERDKTQIEAGVYVSRYNHKLVELGKKLRLADIWLMARHEIRYLDQEFIKPLGLPFYNYFISQDDLEKLREHMAGSFDDVRIIYLNNLDYLKQAVKGNRIIHGFSFYGGNRYPVNRFGRAKVFEELAGVEFEDEEQKIKKSAPALTRLAILRMDVDNLGWIFRKGLASEKRSFSRYCTLSRSLDYFFKGYLNKIWEEDKEDEDKEDEEDKENKDYSKYTQIIYSGGDDVFIVGKWNVLLYLAKTVQKAFREWTCYSSSFTLSGGMAIVPPKFPLLKAATLAEELEHAAKSHVCGEVKKNAIAFFYHISYHGQKIEQTYFSFNWENEFSYVWKLKKEIKDLLSKGSGLPGSFVNDVFTLMQLANFYYNPEKDLYKPERLAFIWLAAYQLSRAKNQAIRESEVYRFLDKWSQYIAVARCEPLSFKTRYHALQLLAVAAKWAAYERRSKEIN